MTNGDQGTRRSRRKASVMRYTVMRYTQAPRHQVRDYCGGRFGLVTHRWWGNKFCKKVCKDACVREIGLDRDAICRWFGFTRAPHRAHAVEQISNPIY